MEEEVKVVEETQVLKLAQVEEALEMKRDA